jgi:uncharacterized protein
MQDQDKEFVEYVVKSIVGNPDAVSVSRRVDEMGVLLELSVDPADMGKIIGKDGRTAKAIRTLLRVLGAQNQSRVNLKIMEPVGGLRDNGHTMDEANADVDETQTSVPDMPETTGMDDLDELKEE